MLSITKVCQYETPCKLGEGLYIKGSNACWVDIESNLVFCSDGPKISIYPLSNKPSVIYDFNDQEVELGTESGLITLDRTKGVEGRCVGYPHASPEIDVSKYRSNDGGDCGKHRLLGYMHRETPESCAGFIYRVSGQKYKLLDRNISIPNAFIPLSSTECLVSDSMTGEIWCFEINDCGDLKSKTLWGYLNKVSFDGGCIVGDFVLFAVWDAAEIAVFSRGGTLVQKLPVPVLRPTNCKFDHKTSKLWLTSATAGLSDKQLMKYPDSGKTMVFNLRIS